MKNTTEQNKKTHAPEETRRRLLESGLELFGGYSFDGVTTRNLTDRADVNLASIQYYFGGKKGLYLAVARHIVDQVSSWASPQISTIEKILRDQDPDKRACFDLFTSFMDELLNHVLGNPESTRWMGIFLREQIKPTAAFDILYEGIMAPINCCVCKLVGKLLDLPELDEETKLKSYALIGPLLIFHISRAEIVRTLDWEEYDAAAIEAVRKVIHDHSKAVLGLDGAPLKLEQSHRK